MPSFSYPVAPKENIQKTVAVTDKEYQQIKGSELSIESPKQFLLTI